MTDDGVLSFKISMLGPTRVGKTSIVASMLRGGKQMLLGTPVTMHSVDQETSNAITLTRRAFDATLLSGELRPDSLASTSADSYYHLVLDPGVEGAGIGFDLMDFPGEWLDETRRQPHNAQAWRNCLDFIRDSSVLIIPVDAAVLMEASLPRHRAAWPSILTMSEVEEVAEDWAKQRSMRPHEPALAIFVPVKCESYFADNGGWRDDSEELFGRFNQVYAGVLRVIRGNCPASVRLYCPVDTLGCVELRSAEWVHDERETGGWTFKPTFMLRADALTGSATIRTKGIDDVLGALCRQLMEARRAADEEVFYRSAAAFEAASALAGRREGLFKDMWLWASRQRARRRDAAKEFGKLADERRNRLEAIEKVVRDIAGLTPSRRVRGL